MINDVNLDDIDWKPIYYQSVNTSINNTDNYKLGKSYDSNKKPN